MKVKVDTEQQRARVKDHIDAAKLPVTVEVKPGDDDQTDLQRRKMHAMLRDISEQVEWHGVKFDVLTWKRLCTASMLREVGDNPQLIPALDGSGFDIIYEKTSKMGKKKNAALIEWIYAFGGENNVMWRDPKDILNYMENTHNG